MTGYRRSTSTDSEQVLDLQRRHLRAVELAGDWLEIWTLFSEHAWVRAQLEICARKALRKLHAPDEWAADIKQDALVRLGAMIQRDPSLGFDQNRGSYAGWIYRLLSTACLKALRQFRESKHPSREPRDEDRLADTDEWVHQRLELISAIEQLPKTSQQILNAYYEGQEVKAIAKAHRISVRSVYRMIHQIVETLRYRLNR